MQKKCSDSKISYVFLIFLIISLLYNGGCVHLKKETKAAPTKPPIKLKTITLIEAGGNEILIKADQILTYTSVKHLSPLGVVLYFPDTQLNDTSDINVLERGIVELVKPSELTAKGHSSRIEIRLKHDAPYEVLREGSDLRVVFTKSAIDTEIPSLSLTEGFEEKPDAIESTIKTEELYSADKAETKLDTLEFEIIPESKEPARVSSMPEIKPDAVKEPVPPLPEIKPETVKRPVPISPMPKSRPTISKKHAWITGIDFVSEDDGKSSVIVETSNEVDYNIIKPENKKLLLKLFRTRIPKYHQRHLPTQHFDSALNRITPIHIDRNTAAIVMELREDVDYQVEQQNNKLMVHFNASTVPPVKSRLPEWRMVMDDISESLGSPKPGLSIVKKEPVKILPFETDKIKDKVEKSNYTGEKISLEFYETDIKNVFRILREVSGENFAIDSDVTGSVTLSLKKPVPWDQVLDLILRMNQLDMTKEGNIMRISRLETLKKEEAERQAAIEARQKAKEILENLITEYIPINYNNITVFQTHLAKIKTERGSLSIDKHTNTIIMTDIPEKIELAKSIKKKLDTPTLQVMIEARIVEVSTVFSRDIGIRWGGDAGIQSGSDNAGIGPQRGYNILGGTYGFNWAVNYPASEGLVDTGSSIGFNFSRILGLSPLELSARLSAMESQGEIRIISAPKILTLDNSKALIKQGIDYPYTVVEDGEADVKFRSADLTLEVIPHITKEDKRISMGIVATKNDLGSIINGEQSFIRKEAETKLIVNDGETIVIGGIIKTRKSNSNTGVPALSKIPLLGWLFRTKEKKDDKEELLIFITPKIVQLGKAACK
ncbi:type IV pilus assembly protein PilQ [Candidatus Magnetomoraceae bacterium gMMP-15]